MSREDRAWKALGEFIRSQRRLSNMSLRQLGQLARVSNAYISQIERGIYRPSAKVLKSLADALNLSAEAMYARIGLLEEVEPEEGEAPEVEEAIRLDTRLTDDQKEALLGVYRGFLAGA